MLNAFNSWYNEGLLLNINGNCWGSCYDWYFLSNSVFFNLINCQLSSVGDFVWHLDLRSVWCLMLNNEGLINGDCVVDLVPFGLWEFLLNVIWLLLILSDWDLFGDDIWDLLDDGVVDSLGDFVGDGDFFIIRDFVVNCVWYLLRDNVWDFVPNSVWYLSLSDVRNLLLNLKWHLSFHSVRDLS